jgi:clan AA aspartic protease (TIGR02281 family)
MSSLRFNPDIHSIVVEASLKSRVTAIANLVVDTGASYVALPWRLVNTIGITIDPKKTLQITTATTVETVPKVIIPEMTVLGKTVKNVEAIVKDLPPQAPVDGLLGLSFLRNFKLTIDFQKGLLSLD